MARLSTILVQREVASLRDVEEALARHVLYGGDLVSNFLEQTQAAVDEQRLTQTVAEAFDMTAYVHGELPLASERLLAAVPKDLAIRHVLYPLRREGDVLAVAVAEPLSVDAEEEIAFSLGVRIEQVIALHVRIRQALSRTHGLALDRRSARAVAKLGGLPDPHPSRMPSPLEGAPDLSALPRPATIPPFGSLGGASLFRSDPPAPSVHEAITAPAPPVEERRDPPTSPSWPPLSPPPEDAASETGTPPTQRRPAPPAASTSGDALAAWSAREKHPKREQRRARHRGPYTAAEAERDLLEAEERDDVLGAFFDFAAQYFEYAALFAVVGEIAEGRDAHGPGASRNDVTGVGVPLDLPSVLSHARDDLTPQLVKLAPDGLDRQLADDLKRPAGRQVLIVPISVRGRCVVILYGDDGDAGVQLSDVGDVIAFAPLVATGLENVIRRKKAAARAGRTGVQLPAAPGLERAPGRNKLPSRDQRASALAEALEPAGRSVTPPATAVPTGVRPAGAPPPKPTSLAPRVAAPRTSSGPRSPAPPPKPTSLAPREPAPPPKPTSLAPRPGPPPKPTSLAPRGPTPPPKPTSLAPVTSDEAPDDAWDTPATAGAPGPMSAAPPDDDTPGITIGMAEIDESMLTEDPEPTAGVAVVSAAPPRAQRPGDLELPKVIVDTDTDARRLVEEVLAGNARVAPQIRALGASAIAALVEAFPGPLVAADARDATNPAAAGPVIAALIEVGPDAVPHLMRRADDADPEVRVWVTRTLGEIASAESAKGVARRAVDPDPAVHLAARRAGRTQQSTGASRTALRETTCELMADDSGSLETRTLAVQALAEWRDPLSVPRLIPFVAEPPELAPSVRSALSAMTGQTLGADTEAWWRWWEQNADKHRIEWLMEALTHEDREIRRQAGDELKTLTKEYFGYFDDLPPDDLKRVQHRYRSWWDTVGKARFARP